MIGLSRLKRAISDVPTGGMQTGDPKVKLKLCDAKRIEVEYAALIAERDAALVEASKYQEIARQYTELASKGIYYAIEELQQRDLMIKAIAGRAGYLQGIYDWRMAEVNYQNFDITFSATEYANNIRQAGEV